MHRRNRSKAKIYITTQQSQELLIKIRIRQQNSEMTGIFIYISHAISYPNSKD